MSAPDDFDDAPAAVPAPIQSEADRVRRERHTARIRVGRAVQGNKAFSARTQAYIAAMVEDGATWKDAAKAANIPQRVARELMLTPSFQKAMIARGEALRAVEGSKNPVVLAKIRDRALNDEASAAQQRVAVEAMRLLEGKGDGGTTVNIGVSAFAVIGYTIDLSGESAPPVTINQQPPQRYPRDEDDLP